MSDTESLRKNAKRAYKARAFGEAAEIYEALLSVPGDASPEGAAADRLGYASALTSLGRLDEAAVQMDHAIAFAPEDPRLRFKQGEILSRLGRHDQAAAQFEEAIRLAPGVADQHWRLALELRALEREQEAQAELKRCLELEPEHTEARLMQLERIVVSNHERSLQSMAPLSATPAVELEAAWPSLAPAPPKIEAPPMRQRLWMVVLEGIALAVLGLWVRSLWA